MIISNWPSWWWTRWRKCDVDDEEPVGLKREDYQFGHCGGCVNNDDDKEYNVDKDDDKDHNDNDVDNDDDCNDDEKMKLW